MENNNYQRAHRIVGALWRGIPSDYKSKYALNIWSQFENQVRSAAYTSSLSRFVGTVSAKLGISVRDLDVPNINRALAGGDDREMLRLLRDETTYLVLLVREENDQRREQWKARAAK